jgi:hypothetical protein
VELVESSALCTGVNTMKFCTGGVSSACGISVDEHD